MHDLVSDTVCLAGQVSLDGRRVVSPEDRALLKTYVKIMARILS